MKFIKTKVPLAREVTESIWDIIQDFELSLAEKPLERDFDEFIISL